MSDIDKVVDLLEAIRDLLGGSTDNTSLLPPYMVDDYLDAVGEILPEFDRMIDDIRKREPYEQLEQIGFTGKQLDLKVLIFKDAKENFAKYSGRRFYRIILKVISKLLGSLGIMFPAAHAAKEIADLFIFGIDQKGDADNIT